jgi:hypothetical protein
MLTATAALLITFAAPTDAPRSPDAMMTLDRQFQVAPIGEILDLSIRFDDYTKDLPLYFAPKDEIEIA